MTKYILHGGNTGIPNKNNKAFYQEWIKDFKPNFTPNILLVYFSRPVEQWETLKNQDKKRLEEHTNGRLANMTVADMDKNRFIEQVKTADVIYARGGENLDNLMIMLESVKNELLPALNNKIFAGSSAGVMVLSHFTRSDTTDWEEGLGLLPINSFVHYSETWKDNLDKFISDHPENKLEYLLIPESE
ncbi:MAG: Type 1 glutamine amidotransferase-like domain-containing protein, partial [Patescibacteria group bacterium]|nr:Type 1 glutamine amidotransferase-like domain-containing protein [Patescibacteria group bacterium]